MRKYQPIQNSASIEIVQNNHDYKFNSVSSRVYRDPKNQISPRVYRVIRAEQMLKILILSISFVIMAASIILFTLVYAKVGIFNKEQRLVGYLVLFGSSAFISMAIGFKNLIENIQWSHTVQRYRDAVSNGDYTSSSTFHIAYRKIVLKDVNLTWMLVFVLTYLGIITAIVYGLYMSNRWYYETDTLKINFEWAKWLDRGFGNTILFCIISVIIMASSIAAYILIRLFDKKRLADISDFLGERSVEIHEQVEQSKKDRNKMWLRIYLVVVALTILLPLALALVALWRFIVKRRKKVVA
ncbi:MSC_0882 family membrane protein [Mycoplasmopsis fermentans]|nr:hypothetical protein [Mycoplasmopsis fermentans]VEU67104.1 Uncharacterised protein [Mesomycoplasma conjunctivae]ADN69101.1 conserved hypothetical membrane spanning protein [Mycoplasmopsis fermentans JER]ADV34622.1 Conserved Hypothetical Protein [Mycoplasmopsis fermentans M64]RMX35308.1 putative membrane protein [Mycoplasmopsis fermentans MF-I2]RMX35447.1 putative membrane protein [Mycoplasmopsis fermentans MF-I1]